MTTLSRSHSRAACPDESSYRRWSRSSALGLKWFRQRAQNGFTAAFLAAESLDRLLTLDKTNPLSFDKLVLDWARMALIGWAVDQPVEPLFDNDVMLRVQVERARE